MKSLCNDTPAGCFSVADNGDLTGINDTALQILGYNREELATSRVDSILTLSSRIFYQTHLFPLIRIGNSAQEIFITLLSREGKHVPVLLNAKRSTDGNSYETHFAFIVVWNRKKFEEELIAAKRSAEQMLQENSELHLVKNRLEEQAVLLDQQIRLVTLHNTELQELNHAITHTLREPIRKVLMFSSLLQEEFKSASLDNMIRSASRMKTVLSDLQQFVWLNDHETSITENRLSDLVAAAESRLLQELRSHHLQIKMENDAQISGDPELLQLLFYHLLSNAEKFRKGDVAEVVITVTTMNRNAFRYLDQHYRFEEYRRIEVTDKGVGFDENLRSQLFRLFRKLHDGEGSGLGLAICKKIAERHNGSIEAFSKPGEYSRFIVWLPSQLSAKNLPG